jgi:hypothetical protein
MDPARRVQVVATDAEGTRSALAEARRLAADDSEPIVLLVPQRMPAARPLPDPRTSARLTDHYRALAQSAGVEAIVRVCVCRHYRDAFAWMLARQSLVVIGGQRRWWWPTTAERMAGDLKRTGHQVVFTEVG